MPCCWVVAEPGDVLKMFTDEGVTFSAGVPTIWQGIRTALEADPSLAEGLLLNRLACGGSAPAAEMMEWYLQTYDVTFLQAWGMTEVRAAPAAAGERPSAERPASIREYPVRGFPNDRAA